MLKKVNNVLLTIRTAFYIATRSIRRGSLAVNIVTVFILLLTFLNLLVVGGLLNGITEDIGAKVKYSLTGDIYIKPAKEYKYIQNTADIFSLLGNNSNVHSSPRLISGSYIEHGYEGADKSPAGVSTVVSGIDPTLESQVTTIDQKVVTGSFLGGDGQSIMLGSSLVDGYTASETSNGETLGSVKVGDKVRIRLPNNVLNEFTVVGIVHSKSALVDQRVYINLNTLQKLLAIPENDYSEIAITSNSEPTTTSLIQKLKVLPGSEKYVVKSAKESIPSAIADVQKAFGMIGNIVGATALLVGIITVFVIVFVQASNRKRYLGILKAQGISAPTLILAYIFQSFFYVLLGVLLGLIIIFVLLKPYFVSHPVSLPVADGQLFLPIRYIASRAMILIIVSVISAYIPAWLIIKKNTLDSILGR